MSSLKLSSAYGYEVEVVSVNPLNEKAIKQAKCIMHPMFLHQIPDPNRMRLDILAAHVEFHFNWQGKDITIGVWGNSLSCDQHHCEDETICEVSADHHAYLGANTL
jgi:hypothetical protein